MTTIHLCPVCHGRDSFPVFTVEGFPYITAPVKREDKATILKKYGPQKLSGTLQPVVCRKCRHIYLRKHASARVISELYRDYYSYPSAMEGSFFPERDEAFIKIFKSKILKILTKKRKHVLEIGCYDGYVLYRLSKLGFSVTGCDPSHGATIGKRFGIDIKRRFFKAEDFVKEGLKYEVVIFRHFLEHLPRPVDQTEFGVGAAEIYADRAIFHILIPNNAPAFERTCADKSSVEIPRIWANLSAVCTRLAGSLVFPRTGSGARNGESVSKRILSDGAFAATSRRTGAFRKVRMPEKDR